MAPRPGPVTARARGLTPEALRGYVHQADRCAEPWEKLPSRLTARHSRQQPDRAVPVRARARGNHRTDGAPECGLFGLTPAALRGCVRQADCEGPNRWDDYLGKPNR